MGGPPEKKMRGRGRESRAMAAPVQRRDFVWTEMENAHTARRKAILRAHPQVAELQGHEWRSKYICASVVLLHLYSAWLAPSLSVPAFLAMAYFVGAVSAQALFLAIHEMAHNLFFRSVWQNKAFAIMANVPVAVPFAMAFRQFHLDHHRDQGVDGVDADLPVHSEAAMVSKSRLRRALWLSSQIVVYAVRPLVAGEPIRVDAWVCANSATQALAMAALCHLRGGTALAYLLVSAFLAGGLHPCAGHFISEHYFLGDTRQETFSYYGPLNALTWNVGYHNEHHDFPAVPWINLPRLKSVAREYYEPLDQCESWTLTLVRFVSCSGRSLFDRVKREKRA